MARQENGQPSASSDRRKGLHASSAEKRVRGLLSKSVLSISDVSYLLAQVRIALEERQWQGKYTHVNFYCNWALHARLSLSALCYTVLEQMTEALLAYDSGGKEPMEHKVSEILSTRRLRTEFAMLFRDLGLPTDVLDDPAKWTELRGQILFLVLDKPLSFPDESVLAGKRNRKTRARYDSMQQRAKTQGLLIREFSLTTWHDRACRWRMLVDAGKAKSLTIVGVIADP